MSFDPSAIIGAGVDAIMGGLNYGFQREQFEYQKWLNQQTWKREDTAVQRRVADLEAAGLSPTLAAGSSASSTPLTSASAPQVNIGSFLDALKSSAELQMIRQQKKNLEDENKRAEEMQEETLSAWQDVEDKGYSPVPLYGITRSGNIGIAGLGGSYSGVFPISKTEQEEFLDWLKETYGEDASESLEERKDKGEPAIPYKHPMHPSNYASYYYNK